MADLPSRAAALIGGLGGLGGGRLLAWAALPLALYLAFCLALFLWQRSLLYFPQPRAAVPGVELLRLPLADADGVLNISAAQRQRRGAVLYFGGNAEDVALTVPSLAAIFPERSIQAVHYRGYGGSGGRPSEAALVADAVAVLDQLRQQHRDVVVIGRSLGSGVAVQLAAQRPVQRLILLTPFASVLRLAAARFPLVPVPLLLRDRFESWRHAGRVAAPTLIVAAGSDELIPLAEARRLAASFAPGLVRFTLVPDAGHNSPLLEHPALRPLLRGEG
jgi:pimeloyl-ACP methyl ester carboxylesterase